MKGTGFLRNTPLPKYILYAAPARKRRDVSGTKVHSQRVWTSIMINHWNAKQKQEKESAYEENN